MHLHTWHCHRLYAFGTKKKFQNLGKSGPVGRPETRSLFVLALLLLLLLLLLFIHILIGQSPQTQGLLTGYPKSKNESNAWRNRDGDAAVRISDGALFHLSAAK